MGRAVLTAVLALVFAGPVAAVQTMPGLPGGVPDGGSARRAEFYAAVMRGVNESLTAWQEAWASDDAAALAALYTEDALLVLPGGAVLRGRDAIEEHFDSMLPSWGSVRASMVDFDASGEMALVGGSYHFAEQVQGDGMGPTRIAGLHVTVLMQSSGSWRVRSQMFHLPAAAPEEAMGDRGG